MFYDRTVAIEIFYVSNQNEFEEHNRIYAWIAFFTIIQYCSLVEKIKVELLAELIVDIMLWYFIS